MNKQSRLILLLLALMVWDSAAATPDWVEHASQPGPDRPDSGESRFDQLFKLESGHYRIPYPLNSLIDYLDSKIDNGKHSGVRQVFIPFGRSLQRDTPAPHYFRFPRAVIVLEGEPITTADNAGQVLEYRLFIAHQPKTETLEIISYNDSAGRFEFQIVNNYSEKRTTQIQAANRAMCLSCHQNAGPIFARNPWSETSFNVDVAKQLIATLPQQYSSLIGVVTGDAGVIDVLSERANYLSVAQLIWQQGCRTRACRAAMLRAVLQFRLSNKGSFDASNREYRKHYYAYLVKNWVTQWPRGLALANSRITDRDPFSAATLTVEQDPLSLRPAHAVWTSVDSILASGIIYRLAGFLTLTDIQQIDQRLRRFGDSQSSFNEQLQVDCELAEDDRSGHVMRCGTATGLQAVFEVGVQQGVIQILRVMQLRAPGDANILQPDIMRSSPVAGGIDIEPGYAASKLSLRLDNGNRIKSLQLRWNQTLPPNRATLTLELVAEFGLIDQALAKMQHGNKDSLGRKPFQRRVVMRELRKVLDMKPLNWTDENEPVALASAPEEYPVLEGNLALLTPYCGHCHADDTMTPPGFLFDDQAPERVQQCAPRILRRLQAWHSNTDFTGSPMPPPASLAISGTTIDEWPQSIHYRSLVASLEQLVPDDLIKHDYQSLPACLPLTGE